MGVILKLEIWKLFLKNDEQDENFRWRIGVKNWDEK